jgi:putative ABC transport system permease protein
MMNKETPPKLPLRFFRWFCHPKLRDSIEGDLMELYDERAKEFGKQKADLQFIRDVALLFRPGILRPIGGYKNFNKHGMFKSDFKVSLRQLSKNKTFAFINISGLTLGFTCFILLALYLHDELSFDTFHKDDHRIYRVLQHERQDDGTVRNVAPVAPLIGKEAGAQFQDIEDVCRISAYGRVTLGNDPANRDYERILSPDANFFTFFNYPLVEGDPKTVLQHPDAIVISETLATKYFGNESAIGKQIWSAFMRDGKPVYLTVSGVMKDFPPNSHLQISIIFSEATWPSLFEWYNEYVSSDWTSNEYITYLKLRPGSNVSTLANRLKDLVKSNYPSDREFRSEFSLQPLHKIHLYSENIQIQAEEFNANSLKPFYLYMFGAVGTLLPIIACLNYMNLSTAAALKRTREIGTRKALGGQKGQVVSQFLTDALVVSLFSCVVSILLVQLVLPVVNVFTGKKMSVLNLPLSWIVMLMGIILLAAVLSSLYPAFISVRVSVVDALKKEVRFGGRSLPMRKVLLGVQFAISTLMIASTLVIYQQLNYLREKDLGFDHENLLVVDINSARLRRNFETIKEEFSKPAEVVSISTSTRVPGEWKSYPVATVRNSISSTGQEMIFVGIDRDFLKTYDIKLLSGRTIDDPKTDSLKIVLTQLAVEQLGLTNPIGQMIEIPSVRFDGSIENLDNPFRVEVIGVVENFHFESLRNQMTPVIFGAPNTTIQRIDYYTLRIKTMDWGHTIEKLKEINTRLDPDNPLEYTFLDSRFEEFYRADAKRGQIFLTMSVLVVIIACLGLLALVSYSVESRTKEIGVRKILGASVHSIVTLVSKEFLLLIFIAGLISLPIAWYFMDIWLQEFAYRVPLSAGMLVLAMVVALMIAAITISLQTISAARANPVKNLRSE